MKASIISRMTTFHLLWLLLLPVLCRGKRSGSHHHHEHNGGSFRDGPMNVTAVTGVEVDLRCRIRLQDCGNFFSVVWYREQQQRIPAKETPNKNENTPSMATVMSQRVYVYRHNTGRGKSEGPWRGRVEHVYDAKRHVMKVRLRDTRLSDESYYKCEVTYAERGRWFKESCLRPQITRLNMMEAPADIRLQIEGGQGEDNDDGEMDKGDRDTVEDGGTIGPLNEGALLALKCTAEGGKPAPKITWWLGNDLLASSFYEQLSLGEGEPGGRGKGLVRSHVTLVLGRSHLGARIACKVASPAMDTPAVVAARIDMNLAPSALEMHAPQLLSHDVSSSPASYPLTGEGGAGVAEGGTMTVTCVARGAKPAAYIYWNSEPPMDLTNTVQEETQHGLTFDTLNRLTFKAERRLTSLACFASNAVLDQERGMHLSQATTVNVKFRPEVVSKKEEKIRLSIAIDQLVLHCRYEANPMTGARVHWFLDGRSVGFGGDSPFERGSEDASVLRTKGKADKRAEGNYSCQVENQIGRSKRTPIAHVLVEEKPRVSLSVEPTVSVSFDKDEKNGGISELLNANVTLTCAPADLSKKGEKFVAVKWFLDRELLRAVSLDKKCLDDEDYDVKSGVDIEVLEDCQTDPAKIVLLNVRRLFGGNYSCQGRSAGGGWGAESPPTELKVLYPPRGARLRVRPDVVKKGAAFQLECSADDSGFPPATRADWRHNGQSMAEVSSLTLRVAEAAAASAGNYSCRPRNEAGPAAEAAEENVEVHVAPRFVKRLPRIAGAPFNRRQFQLACMVECDPVCSISWAHNGHPVKVQEEEQESGERDIAQERRFRVRESVWPPSIDENRLLSVESILEIDLVSQESDRDPWPRDEVAEAVAENSGHNYSCAATGNVVGRGVVSHTTFRVHYPPRNITVGKRTLTVLEKSLPDPLDCQSDAFPPAKYYWQFEGFEMEDGGGERDEDGNGEDDDASGRNSWLLAAPNASISEGPLRHFRHPVSRRQAGTYTCTAYNDLGNQKSSVTLRVLHPPSCRIRKEFRRTEEVEKHIVDFYANDSEVMLLRCDVTEALPRRNLTFSWFHDGILLRTSSSVLALPGSAEGAYACRAQNSVGAGPRCPIKVRPRPVAALVAETGYSTYLMFGGIAVAGALVALAAFALFCRRMAFGKYDFPPSSTENRPSYEDEAPNIASPPPPPAVNGNGTLTRTHHQGILKSSQSNGHARMGDDDYHLSSSTLTRNGVGRGAPDPPAYHGSNHRYNSLQKRVTLNHQHQDVDAVDAVMNDLMMEEEEEMLYPPPPPPAEVHHPPPPHPSRHPPMGGGILRGGRTFMRAPRELWLV